MKTILVVVALLSLGSAWGNPPAATKKAPCDPKACFEEGKAAFNSRDDARALTLLDQACTGGTLDACCHLGVMYGEGRGVLKNVEKAAEIYAKACKAGGALACVYEGRAWLYGSGVARDPAKAAAKMSAGCEGGNLLGCYFLGTQYEQGNGVPRDYPQAAELFQKAIDGGEGLGLYGLGTMLLQGHGFPMTPANDVRAFDLLSQICKRGDQASCVNVGFMHLTGRGTKKDVVKAADLFEVACTKTKDPMGCMNFGMALEDGVGRPTDKKRGKDLIRSACDAGLKQACDELKR